MTERWANISWTDGRYSVSDQGRVRSDQGQYAGRILCPQKVNSGYLIVHLYIPQRKAVLVSRLVCEAFHGPSRGREVNHLNFNRLDNRAVNLVWTSHHDNVAHTNDAGRQGSASVGVVVGTRADGTQVWYASAAEAERALSGSGRNSSAIYHCLVGRKKSAYGCTWARA